MVDNSGSYIKNLAYPLIVIVGPTASGKSNAANLLASRINGEVISADSMQIYRGMDIGTGKISREEMLVPHFGLDLLDPGEPYSAALFQKYGRACVEDSLARGSRSVLSGGTGFYVRAVIDDYDFAAGEQADNPVREKYNAYAREQGSEALWQLLKQQDPESAAVISPNDTKRVVRAFEMIEEGDSYARRKAALATIPQYYPVSYFGLSVDPAILNNRIEARVDAMFDAGLVREVEGLLEEGFREGLTAPQAIGYKEVVDALDGNISLEEASILIKTATRRYAKRQRTWFRKDKRTTWIDANDGNAERIVEQIVSILDREREDA